MIRTEVLQTKNLRKSVLFKAVNIIAVLIVLFILSISLKLWGSNESINQFFIDYYDKAVKPIIYGVALLIIVVSMYTTSKIKAPKRLGALEIEEGEFRYIEHDEVLETYKLEDLKAIDFEFYSIRMRSNPNGALNYLTLTTKTGQRTFEISVGNSMEKTELGEIFRSINKKVPVKINFSYTLKKLFKDKDFQL